MKRTNYMQEMNQIGNYTDKELEAQIKLSSAITDQDLKKFGVALRVTLAGYVVVLVLLLLNAIFWHNLVLSAIFILYFVVAFLVVEHFDRKSDRSIKRFSRVVEEMRVRTAYKLGFEEGKLAAKKVVKKAVKKAVKQVKDGGKK